MWEACLFPKYELVRINWTAPTQYRGVAEVPHRKSPKFVLQCCLHPAQVLSSLCTRAHQQLC